MECANSSVNITTTSSGGEDSNCDTFCSFSSAAEVHRSQPPQPPLPEGDREWLVWEGKATSDASMTSPAASSHHSQSCYCEVLDCHNMLSSLCLSVCVSNCSLMNIRASSILVYLHWVRPSVRVLLCIFLSFGFSPTTPA